MKNLPIKIENNEQSQKNFIRFRQQNLEQAPKDLESKQNNWIQPKGEKKSETKNDQVSYYQHSKFVSSQSNNSQNDIKKEIVLLEIQKANLQKKLQSLKNQITQENDELILLNKQNKELQKQSKQVSSSKKQQKFDGPVFDDFDKHKDSYTLQYNQLQDQYNEKYQQNVKLQQEYSKIREKMHKNQQQLADIDIQKKFYKVNQLFKKTTESCKDHIDQLRLQIGQFQEPIENLQQQSLDFKQYNLCKIFQLEIDLNIKIMQSNLTEIKNNHRNSKQQQDQTKKKYQEKIQSLIEEISLLKQKQEDLEEIENKIKLKYEEKVALRKFFEEKAQESMLAGNDEKAIKDSIQDLSKGEVNFISQELIRAKLCCCLCQNIMIEPVTITPCGHTFCENCKHGYLSGSCLQCGDKKKIDSAYRNEFLLEIKGLLQLVENSKHILEGKYRNIVAS